MSQQDFANRSSYCFEDVYAYGKQAGWQQCLDSVRASLQMYPNGGGDIDIMKEVERLCAEAFSRGYLGAWETAWDTSAEDKNVNPTA